VIFLKCRRAVALAWALLACMACLALARLRRPLTPVQRALWLKSACRGVLSSIGVDLRIEGGVPARGLVVSNHLSYLDIAVYSAAMPCVFVSKAEVRRWPYFGIAARASGTIFLDRANRASAAEAAAGISDRLKLPVPVLLFPEGTSTDGSQVLRFHSTLFQPAIDAGAPVTAAAVRYAGAGVPESALCWFGDEGFLHSLWRILAVRNVTAEVRFADPRTYTDRRTATNAAQSEVASMRQYAGQPPAAEEMHTGR
jgi:1-acyl-sn-glycerol-3-phosphate acyltransferase